MSEHLAALHTSQARRGPLQRGRSSDEAGRPVALVLRPLGLGDLLTGAGSDKPYRCPGCDQVIPPRTPHVVTWPAYARDSDLEPWDTESAADWRRHWHTACWRARDRRR